VVDETGQIATGKLIFSPTAWEELLGRSAQQLAESDSETLQYLEQRLLFLRVHLGFGWCIESTASSTVLKTTKEAEPGQNKPVDQGGVLGKDRKRKRPEEAGDIASSNADEEANSTNRIDATYGDGIGEVGRLCIWCVKI